MFRTFYQIHRTLGPLALLLFLGLTTSALAQVTPPATPAEAAADDDFDAYGDAAGPATSYATQKVLYLSPTRLISFGYEGQGPFDLRATRENLPGETGPEPTFTDRVQMVRGLRIQTNTPVISRSNIILNVGVQYWNSAFEFDPVPVQDGTSSGLARRLERGRGMRTGGLQATLFKPLDSRRFLIVQGQADVSGNYLGFDELSAKNLTYSGTAIYGWKPSDNLMWGLGVTRTYRAGQVLHIPVLMFNRTFNQRWGIEAILPAKAGVRYNFSTTSFLIAGYEIEGNTFYLTPSGVGGETGDMFLRRGELKPRIGYEQRLTGFIWLAAQAGIRWNYRFAAFDSQNPGGSNNQLFSTRTGLPFYANLSINLVSP